MEKLQADMNHISVASHLKQTHELAKVWGIAGTPSYVINGEMHSGNPSPQSLGILLDKLRD